MKAGKYMTVAWMAALLALLQPGSASACAACFGKSDSPMAQGMNMGIFSLLGVVVFVLGGFGALIFHLARRGAAYAAQQAQLSETTEQS
jgi:hypothetical protein